MTKFHNKLKRTGSLLAVFMLFLSNISCISTTSKSNSTIVFHTQDEEITVEIYKPIDNSYNQHFVSEKLKVKPNKKISYDININRFDFIQCCFPNGKHIVLLVEGGDHIEISYTSEEILISGSNAEGNNYYNNNYIKGGLGYYSDIIEKDITEFPLDFTGIYNTLQHDLIEPSREDLKKMEVSGSITPSFSSIMEKNLYLGYCSILHGTYDQWLTFKRNNYLITDYTPTDEDVRIMLLQLKNLYDASDATSYELSKLPYHFSSNYKLIYDHLDNEEKAELLDKNRDYIDSYYLLLPDSLELSDYGQELIFALQEWRLSSYAEERLLFLRNKYPDSEYVAIINNILSQKR